MNKLISVVIVTNASSPHLITIIEKWKEQFTLGTDLFLCGPLESLSRQKIDPSAIINYVDPEDQYPFFRINEKKYLAGLSRDSRYIYFVHDRFYPAPGFRDILVQQLDATGPDYGAADVFNADGTPSLTELRLKKTIISGKLVSSLLLPGRLVLKQNATDSSDRVAINGGQFFLRNDHLHVLNRPLRWSEMEDDVLSYDLKDFVGCWISGSNLISVIHKVSGDHGNSPAVLIRYFLYRQLCNILKALMYFYLKISQHAEFCLSVGGRLSLRTVEKLDSVHCIALLDPCHKIYATQFLSLSLEKLLALCRLKSEGKFPRTLTKTFYGWLIR